MDKSEHQSISVYGDYERITELLMTVNLSFPDTTDLKKEKDGTFVLYLVPMEREYGNSVIIVSRDFISVSGVNRFMFFTESIPIDRAVVTVHAMENPTVLIQNQGGSASYMMNPEPIMGNEIGNFVENMRSLAHAFDKEDRERI